jgi:two-component system, NtrC family, sensor kinase
VPPRLDVARLDGITFQFAGEEFPEGSAFRTVAMHDVPPAFAELREREPVVVPTPGGGLDQLTKTKQVVHITDYSALPPQARGRLGDLGGARTVVTVPMFKDNDLAGAIVIYRQEVLAAARRPLESWRQRLHLASSRSILWRSW